MVSVTITGVHCPITESVREYAVEKFSHLERFHHGLHSVHITIHEEMKQHTFRVDVEMHIGHTKHPIAHDTDATIQAALDKVLDKCANQLRKLHDKAKHRSDRQKAINV